MAPKNRKPHFEKNEEVARLYQMLLNSQAIAHIGAYETNLVAKEFSENTWVGSPEINKIFGIDDKYPHTLAGWAEFIHPDSREELFAYHKQVVDERRRFFHQYKIIRMDDRVERWVQGTGEIEYDTEGNPSKMIGTIQDITDQKLLEDEKNKLQIQLQQSQKMESMGVLAGGVAHDMNNVLGAILALASTFVEIEPKGSPTYGAFDTIIKAATRGGGLVKSLLAFARQTLPSEQVLDLNTIIQDEVQILANTTLAKIHLKMDLAQDLQPILGDASALTHAFMNLCVNAVDAMPETGTLTLRTRNVEKSWIEVTVEDNGFGMSEEVLTKALDPFFTTKGVGKGTGLGLPMVYSTVKAHHGLLELRSKPNQGTTIRIRFPAYDGDPLKLVTSPVPVKEERRDTGVFPRYLPEKALTVLVVDDDEMIRNTMQTIIDYLGHTIILARTGEEALAKIQARFVPDVVILDINMPGMGGFKTLPILRSLLPEVPVILATGRVDQTAIDLSNAYPKVTLRSKPFTIDELKADLKNSK